MSVDHIVYFSGLNQVGQIRMLEVDPLIEAAPDMLAALKAALPVLEILQKYLDNYPDMGEIAVVDDIRNAISRAEATAVETTGSPKDSEIDITPDMIDAGMDALTGRYQDLVWPELDPLYPEIICSVYQAMVRANQTAVSSGISRRLDSVDRRLDAVDARLQKLSVKRGAREY